MTPPSFYQHQKKNNEWNKDIQKYKDQEAPLDPKRWVLKYVDRHSTWLNWRVVLQVSTVTPSRLRHYTYLCRQPQQGRQSSTVTPKPPKLRIRIINSGETGVCFFDIMPHWFSTTQPPRVRKCQNILTAAARSNIWILERKKQASAKRLTIKFGSCLGLFFMTRCNY